MTTHSKQLTIFEGVDGSGKSTIAKEYAEATGALYVHFPALPHVTTGLSRLYVEAMLPALLGHQEVVFDRSWYSEPIYGAVHRGGTDRVGLAARLMLERLAMRCGAVVVRCDPGWGPVALSYAQRKGTEYLDSLGKVENVWELYGRMQPQLPLVNHNYFIHDLKDVLLAVDTGRMAHHPLEFNSAGNLAAKVVLVGDTLAERKNDDPWYQWPFASFSKLGCSQWLTTELAAAGINEYDLLWINKKDVGLLTHENGPFDCEIIALGNEAEAALQNQDEICDWKSFPHPQSWKRFQGGAPYPLIDYIKKILETA